MSQLSWNMFAIGFSHCIHGFADKASTLARCDMQGGNQAYRDLDCSQYLNECLEDLLPNLGDSLHKTFNVYFINCN